LSKDLTIKQVLEVFPHLNRRTLGAAIEHGIIKPATPSPGERIASRFNKKNLEEIALLLQLNRAGIDSRKFLEKLFQFPTQAGRPLIDYLQFKDFLIVPVRPFFDKEPPAGEEEEYDFAFWRTKEQMGDLYEASLACGWIVVDFRCIRKFVQEKMANL
jgi:hypothetical protein